MNEREGCSCGWIYVVEMGRKGSFVFHFTYFRLGITEYKLSRSKETFEVFTKFSLIRERYLTSLNIRKNLFPIFLSMALNFPHILLTY